jgi:hypothetical protein
MRCDRRIGPRDHFKLKIGDKAFNGYWRMLLKVTCSPAADLFAAKKGKYNCSFRSFSAGQGGGQLQDSNDTRSIVIGAVKNVVAGHSFAHTEMIEMSGKQNGFFR